MPSTSSVSESDWHEKTFENIIENYLKTFAKLCKHRTNIWKILEERLERSRDIKRTFDSRIIKKRIGRTFEFETL